MPDIIFQKINQQFKSADKILIISHRRPDSDAIGSSLAIFFYLKGLGKNPTLFNIGPMAAYFDFLPGIENVCSDEKILDNKFDLVITLDLSSLDHSGLNDKVFKNNYVINIDHHISNHRFGHINLVDDQASSTCEVIYKIFSEINFNINKNISLCLLCGLLGDTGNLSNSATNTNSLVIASELIGKGGRIYKIDDLINRNKSINGLRLWGQALSRLKTDDNREVAFTYIKEEEYQEYQINEAELDGLTNFLNVISDVKFIALFRISPDFTRVGMRTIRDDIDLSEIAKINGGGGHKKAAGFALPYALNEQNCDFVSYLKNTTQ